MKVREMNVDACSIQEVKDFVEKWHYSKNVNGITVTDCFMLKHDQTMIGAMIFGTLGMANAWRKYGENQDDVRELRRLCCIDETPKNTESFFIGRALRWLKHNTSVKTIVSYADQHHGHSGVIYQASNFQHVGMTARGKVIVTPEKVYHDKAIRTYYKKANGEKVLKPFALRLKKQLETGEAYYDDRPSKHIYVYELKRKRGAK